MEKLINISFNLDNNGIILTSEDEEIITQSCVQRITEQYEKGFTSGELVETFNNNVLYGYYNITEFNLDKTKAIEEINSEKQIMWRNKPFQKEELKLIIGKYCDYVEESTCILAYLKPF